MLRIAKNDEKVNASTTIVNGNGQVVYSVSPNGKDGETYMGSTVFDFAGVSADQIKMLAIDGLTIRLQSRLRSTYRAQKNGGEKGMLAVGKADVVKVLEMISTRARVDNVEKGKKLIASMTPEQRKALLAELNKAK